MMESENFDNKSTEKTLEKSESYKEIFFNDHTVMLLIDPVTLKIVDANLAAIKFYGYSLEEFVNLKISDINIASDEFVWDKIQRSVSKEKNHFIFKHQLSNGEIRDVEVYSGLIKQKGNNVLYSIIHDITDNQQQTTLKRFYTVLSSMYGAILLVSNTDQVEFANQAFCDFFKLEESPEDLIGLESTEIIEKIKNEYLYPEEAILRINEIVSLKKPVKGEEVDLQNGRTCIRDYIPINISKKFYGRLWHHTDITERKQAENELKERENKFRTFFENIMDAILLTIPDGTILAANPAAEKLFGYTEEEICKIGRNGLVDLEDPNLPILINERTLKGKTQGELTFIKKDGTTFPGEISTSIFKDGNENKRTTMVIRDITERKKDEEALRESESRFHSVLDNSQDVIYRLNLQKGIYEYISPSAEKVVGFTPDELMALDPTNSLNMIYPDDRGDMQAAITKLEQNDKVELEYRQRTKNGEYRWISNKMIQIKDNTGRPLFRDGNIHDITERKKAENEIKKTMDELRRSNQELERFAYVSSHDLQEPLRMVTIYSQLLENRYKDRLDNDANDFIEYIVENAKRMKQLIDDLLEYSRVTSQAKEFENIELEKVLDIVLSNSSMSIVENNVKVTQESLPTIFADQNQMLQVFQNLITNAIKFRGEKSPEINISAQKGENEWTFCISDNGIGIKPEHQKQIFDVFKRLHTREEYPGTGIGLSIVKKIIDRHSGRIWVESELRKGSIFYFTIPNK